MAQRERGCAVQVQVAATPILQIAGAAAYHCSVVLGKHEYYFDAQGIMCAPALWSHSNLCVGRAACEPEVIEVGRTTTDLQTLRRALSPFFKAGSYDVLLKNCNTFVDAAIFFLTRSRLEGRFTRLERLVASTRPLSTKLLAAIAGLASRGEGPAPAQYEPNPRAVNFCLEATLGQLAAEALAAAGGDDVEGASRSSAAVAGRRRPQPPTTSSSREQQRTEEEEEELDEGEPLQPVSCNPLAGCYKVAVETLFDEMSALHVGSTCLFEGFRVPTAPEPPPPPCGKRSGSLLSLGSGPGPSSASLLLEPRPGRDTH